MESEEAGESEEEEVKDTGKIEETIKMNNEKREMAAVAPTEKRKRKNREGRDDKIYNKI